MKVLQDYFTPTFTLEQIDNDQTSLLNDVLVDADALVALAKRDDSNHKIAVAVNQKLQAKGVSYILSPFTIAEATTVLSYKVSHQAAKKFLEEIRKINLTEFDFRKECLELADKWFKQQSKNSISYFDCYNMALMERYQNQLVAIFSFDWIYPKNGFKTAQDLTV